MYYSHLRHRAEETPRDHLSERKAPIVETVTWNLDVPSLSLDSQRNGCPGRFSGVANEGGSADLSRPALQGELTKLCTQGVRIDAGVLCRHSLRDRYLPALFAFLPFIHFVFQRGGLWLLSLTPFLTAQCLGTTEETGLLASSFSLSEKNCLARPWVAYS